MNWKCIKRLVASTSIWRAVISHRIPNHIQLTISDSVWTKNCYQYLSWNHYHPYISMNPWRNPTKSTRSASILSFITQNYITQPFWLQSLLVLPWLIDKGNSACTSESVIPWRWVPLFKYSDLTLERSDNYNWFRREALS